MASIACAAIASTAHFAYAQRGAATRSRRGDTVVVTTNGNGVWGAPHDAIEVKRIGGDTKETTFGEAYTLEATPDGGVLVVDAKSLDGLIVRQFDANGNFVHNIGARGSGPGEYTRSNLTLAVHPNGTILIRDDEISVSRFAPNGKLINSFSLFYTNGGPNETVPQDDGSIYLRAPFLRGPSLTPGPGLLLPMIHYDSAGRVLDSIADGPRWLPVAVETSQLHQYWTVLPNRQVLYMRTDKVGFLIADRSGTIPPFIAEAPSAPVPYLKAEHDEVQARRDFSRDNCVQPGATQPPRTIVPPAKLPAYFGFVDVDRRIWIRKSTTALKVPPKVVAQCGGPAGSKFFSASYEEPPAFAAFQLDGTFLGEVRFPLRARVTFVGNTAWALVPDADDVPVLIKYKLHN